MIYTDLRNHAVSAVTYQVDARSPYVSLDVSVFPELYGFGHVLGAEGGNPVALQVKDIEACACGVVEAHVIPEQCFRGFTIFAVLCALFLCRIFRVGASAIGWEIQ